MTARHDAHADERTALNGRRTTEWLRARVVEHHLFETAALVATSSGQPLVQGETFVRHEPNGRFERTAS